MTLRLVDGLDGVVLEMITCLPGLLAPKICRHATFSLWRYIKSLVCVSKSADIKELKQRICDAFSTITTEMGKNVMLEYKQRLHEVLENGSSHVKVYAP